jgi:integrase
MPRGQKPGWRDRQKATVERPVKPVKQEAGIWLYPSGKFGAFLYKGQTSVFLGMSATVEAARELRSAAKKELSAGQAPAARMAVRVSLATFFDETFVPDKLAGNKDSTKRAAVSRFNAHLRGPLGESAVGSIDYSRLSSVRAALVGRDNLSGQTKREVLLLLRQVFDEAVRHGLLPKNPASLLEFPKKVARKVKIPDLVVVRQVIDAVTHPVARMLAELLLRTGLRLNEATALKWSDIDEEERRLHVRRSIDPATKKLTTPKTAESFRVVDIPQSLVALLKAYHKVKPSDDWVFPSEGDGPFDGRNFAQRYWAPAVTAAKAPRLTPHGLRHCFASCLLQSGTEILYVANQLGHTSTGFTLSQYGHLLRDTSPSRAKLESAFPG